MAPMLGINWPPDQVFPSFGTVGPLDVVKMQGQAPDVLLLAVTLEGIVNRTQPRIYLSDGGDSDKLWQAELHVATTAVTDPLTLVTKYRSEVKGIVIYDDTLADTINLATTIAGVEGGVVASPALAAKLGAAPYNLPTIADLRTNHFASKLDVYQYELDHYATKTSHRLIIGLTPSIVDHLRDYAVANKAFAVWLDPRDAAEKQMLAKFLSLLPPNSPYLGWWLDEPTGVQFASTYGVPVYAADWSLNLTVLGGSARGSKPPQAPPPPKLENKVYVAIFMSDGDNLQEDEGLVPLKWADSARGSVPIAWTLNPALVDVGPVMLRYYQRTATLNDVLVSGPSGLGYTYPQAWPGGTFDQYAKVSGAYTAAAGFRVITLWNNGADLSQANAKAYSTHAPGLVGMTIQDSTTALQIIDGWLPIQRMALSYGDNETILEGGIDNQLKNFNGTAPLFVAVQGNMNMGTIQPTAFQHVQDHYANNTNVVFVRADHFFQLLLRNSAPPAHRVFSGDYNGDGKTDALMYYSGDGNWWMGLSDGSQLSWHNAGNTAGFGNLLDGGHAFYQGDFNHDGKADVLFYFSGDGNWWLGSSDGNMLTWKVIGNNNSLGNVVDGKHRVSTGDYNNDGKTDVLVYNSGDGNWSMGISDGSALTWSSAGNTGGFGNLLDGSHALYDGDFDGDGKADVLFYYNGDQNLWLGRSNGSALSWSGVGNTTNFGNLIDRSHRLVAGDFNGDHKTDLLFYYAGDGNWWLGGSTGNGFTWTQAASTAAMGNFIDWNHRWYTGDFDHDGKLDVLAQDSGSGDWWIGRCDGTALTWTNAGNTNSFGDVADFGHIVLQGDFNNDGKADVMFYNGGDSNWWLGQSDGKKLDWHMAGTTGFGDLTH
jgi:hypothetical protein